LLRHNLPVLKLLRVLCRKPGFYLLSGLISSLFLMKLQIENSLIDVTICWRRCRDFIYDVCNLSLIRQKN
jgi:hypothetical protein